MRRARNTRTSAASHSPKSTRHYSPWILSGLLLTVAYGLLGLTFTAPLTHANIMQRCVLVDPNMARIWSVGNIEIGVAYLGVFIAMTGFFVQVFQNNRAHLRDLGMACLFLACSFCIDYLCVRQFSPFVALLVGDAVIMTFTVVISRQIWFQRLLGVFVPIIFLTCGIGHFLEGLSYWHLTYPFNVPWTMVTADIGFAVLINSARFPAFIRGQDVAEELKEARALAEELDRQLTVTRQAEEELRESDARMQAIVNTAVDGIITIDALGTIQSFNPAAIRIFGYEPEEVLGCNVSMLMPESYASEHDGYLAHHLETGEKKIIGIGREVMGRRKDGTVFPLDLAVSSSVQQGKEQLFVGIVRDITERKNAEEALKQQTQELARSNADLEQFAYVASHDLQEPLRMVASYMTLLSRRYRGQLDADADAFIHYAVDGAERMKTLIKDLLVYSRIATRGKEFEPVSTVQIYASALANLQTAIAESGAEITCDDLPVVRGDEAQLVSLFQNLIGNALKYRGEAAPQVHISVERREKEWLFPVADNGMGIEAQYFERIFVIFQRLHSKEEYAGTGIGLGLCKKIVERHGGQIGVRSEPGRGSAFFFTLPVNAEEAASAWAA